MPAEVLVTPRADQQIDALTRRHRSTLDLFLDALAAEGCRALAYRLAGDTPINHVCVKHLDDTLRAVVVFETTERAWLLLVGRHNNDPVVDVYVELYRMLDVTPPESAGREQPPCCGEADELPPVIGPILDDILERATQVRRTRRRR